MIAALRVLDLEIEKPVPVIENHDLEIEKLLPVALAEIATVETEATVEIVEIEMIAVHARAVLLASIAMHDLRARREIHVTPAM